MKKKVLVLALALSLVAVTALGVTLAYFTDTAETTNTFTMGNVEIKLREPKWDGFTFDQEITALPEEPTAGNETLGYYEAKPLLPGDSADKNPMIMNVGSNDAYVRMKVTVDNVSKFVEAAENYEGDLLGLIVNGVIQGENLTNWEMLPTPIIDNVKDTLTIIFNYKTKLAPNATTDALFTGIALPSTLTQEVLAPIQESGFTIKVTAEAIQVENFADYTTALAELNNA